MNYFKDFREKSHKKLKNEYKIPIEYELHATKFISGSGAHHNNTLQSSGKSLSSWQNLGIKLLEE